MNTENKWFSDERLKALSQGYPPVEFDNEQTITRLALECISLRSQKAKVMTALKHYANIHKYSGAEKMAVDLLKELEE